MTARPLEDSFALASACAEEIVARYGDLVYHLSVRLTGDRDAARDLSQEAFLKILKGAPRFRGESSPRTWICQVVINCHRNQSRLWRRLKRSRTVSLDQPVASGAGREDGPALADTLADDSPGVERLALSAEAARRLEAEMGRLPADQRAALVLREIEQMSYEEIAAALQVRTGTVKSRIARAREALRVALADLRTGVSR
jgi:RNA polymerase sigma-70 factor (ECF subfamily)